LPHRRQEHRRLVRPGGGRTSDDRRPGRLAPGRHHRPGACRPAPAPDRHRAGIPGPLPRDDEPVGRGIATREDGPPPWEQPQQHELHLRRAQRGPASAGCRAPERVAAPTLRQGQYRAGGGARPRHHRGGRSCHRHGAGGRRRRRQRGVRGRCRRAAAGRHGHGALLVPAGAHQHHAANALGLAADRACESAQSERRERLDPEGRDDRRDGRGRVSDRCRPEVGSSST
jgi:hypothetical protein